MINLPPIQTAKRIDVKTIPAVLKSWQIGQILESRAKTSSNAEGELQIQIGQHLLDARTKTPIQAGEELKLQVSKLGQQPLLKIMTQPLQTDPITLYLRQAVPDNKSIQRLLSLLGQYQLLLPDYKSQPPSTETKALQNLTQHISGLLQIPLKAEKLSAENIQHFLHQSGVTFEKQLFAHGLPSKDLKMSLFQIKQAVVELITSSSHQTLKKEPQVISALISNNKLSTLASYLLYAIPPADKRVIIDFISQSSTLNPGLLNDSQQFLLQAIQKLIPAQVQQLKQWIQFIPALAEIRQLVEQSINTINNHQLQSLQADADSAFLVLFNLLIAKNPDWIDLFNIKISKEESDADNEKHWNVTIQLDMPDLGLVEAKLTLINQDLHAGISSESSVTYQLIDQNLPLLHNALTHAGFNVATISCKQQKISPLDSLSGHKPLLEDQA